LLFISAGEGEVLALLVPQMPALTLIDRKILENLPNVPRREFREVFGVRLKSVEV
jgi:hypothetical protein